MFSSLVLEHGRRKKRGDALTTKASQVALAKAAAEAAAISASSSWVLACAAIALVAGAPGIALAHKRRGDAAAAPARALATMAAASLSFLGVGYSLAFAFNSLAPTTFLLRWFGALDLASMVNVSTDALVDGVPELAWAALQLAHAVLAAAIAGTPSFRQLQNHRAGGAVSAVFAALFVAVVYAPICRLLWAGGFFATRWNALDFSGSIVVHVAGGAAAMGYYVFGGTLSARSAKPAEMAAPLTETTRSAASNAHAIGVALLWLTTLALVGGSTVVAGASAATAILSTHAAAAAGLLTWQLVDFVFPPTVMPEAEGARGMDATMHTSLGAVAGLAAASGVAGFITVNGGILIGIVAAAAARIVRGMGAGAVHCMGGAAGAILLGLVASPAAPFYGTGTPLTAASQTGVQIATVCLTFAYSFVVGGLCAFVGAVVGAVFGGGNGGDAGVI